MIKFPIPKLLKWLITRFFISLFLSLVLGVLCFYFFFDNKFSFPNFISIFLLGFVFCGFICIFLFARFLYPLSRVFTRIQRINQGKSSLTLDRDFYLDEEPGEFYEINKILNQINNYLRWQKRIISQESSELEAIISSLTGAILAVDQDQKVLFFNNQATAFFSAYRKTYKSEIYLSEMIRNPDILQVYKQCLKEGKIIKKTLSIRVFDAEEEDSFYEITVAPLKESSSEIFGVVGLFYDITNIRKIEKIQLDFITNVSHELRTPLTAIKGYVETLLNDINFNNKEQIEQFLIIIRRNVQRLVSLLNHFLDLAKMEDSLVIKKELLNTEEVTQSIVKDLHIKNHTVKMEFSQKTVVADRHFLKQVLYNLIDNAIKYVPSGRLIEIFWTKKNNEVILTVKDQGEGIPSRHKDRLFEKFYRVDPARKGEKGAGVGLSIVKQIVEKHGGKINIKSEPNEGSSFFCSFPNSI